MSERTIYSANQAERPPQVHKTFEGDSRTRQSEAAETDINEIVAKYQSKGVITHVNKRAPFYGDDTQAVSLQKAFDVVMTAADAFDSLPAAVRKAAGNDPVEFLQMCQDEDQVELLRNAGLDLELERVPADQADQVLADLDTPPSKPAPVRPAAAPAAAPAPAASGETPSSEGS